jgi:hypothetical protein
VINKMITIKSNNMTMRRILIKIKAKTLSMWRRNSLTKVMMMRMKLGKLPYIQILLLQLKKWALISIPIRCVSSNSLSFSRISMTSPKKATTARITKTELKLNNN